MTILQRNRHAPFISHTTNILLFKFLCNILIGFRIIKEMQGSVASRTPCIIKSKHSSFNVLVPVYYIDGFLYAFKLIRVNMIKTSVICYLVFEPSCHKKKCVFVSEPRRHIQITPISLYSRSGVVHVFNGDSV